MQNREFENKVQEKMDGLKLTPSDAVWDKVEASLPKEKKRRWVILILLFAILMAGGLFVWNNTNKNATTNIAQETGLKNEASQVSIAQEPSVENKRSADTLTAFPTTKDKSIISLRPVKNKKETLNATTRIKIKRSVGEALPDSKDPNLLNTTAKELITKGDTKVKIKKPQPGDNEEVIATADNVTVITAADIVPVTVIQDSINAIPAITTFDSSVAVKRDTAITVAKENKKTKKTNPLHYGVELAGGNSNVKNNLFSNAPVYADFMANAVSFPGGGNPVNVQPDKPARSTGLTIGFYAERKINHNWTFKTGLNYLYQSNKIKVGTKIDSSINFAVDINKSFTASSYYRAGNAMSYTNKFHLLEIPLIFQYQFTKTSRFYAEAGPSITYLIQSNALVYSPQSKAYVTDKDIFNKLGVSINGGLAINLARNTALPFSIGYKFKYGVGSIVKTSFGKQHFINSFLCLKIPFKK